MVATISSWYRSDVTWEAQMLNWLFHGDALTDQPFAYFGWDVYTSSSNNRDSSTFSRLWGGTPPAVTFSPAADGKVVPNAILKRRWTGATTTIYGFIIGGGATAPTMGTYNTAFAGPFASPITINTGQDLRIPIGGIAGTIGAGSSTSEFNFSRYTQNVILNLVTNQVTTPPAFSTQTNWYMGLITSLTDSSGTITEVSGGSYARQAITRQSVDEIGITTAPTRKHTFGLADLTFTNLPAATIRQWGIWDAATGGNLLFFGYLQRGSSTVTAGQSLILPGVQVNVGGLYPLGW